ncbi:hypothetical protein BC835DRAFT_1410897 [Cytidiella melzeri]|nr:hypothetical protein BC835DRAFT_1410897 [Cytidiella melzeri]
MKFTNRNAFYLRLSAGAVLPLYLYLDDQHVTWMSERVLQHVLSDLRPLIIPKLIAEESANVGPGGSNAKKGTFGYFLRNTDPHAVLVKTRRFTAASKVVKPVNMPPPVTSPSTKTSGKRAVKSKGKAPSKKGKGKAKQVQIVSEEEDAEFSDELHMAENNGSASNVEQLPTRRSARRRTAPVGNYAEDTGVEDSAETTIMPSDVAIEKEPDHEWGEMIPAAGDEDIAMGDERPLAPREDTLINDEEEEKPKPVMKLLYQGFSVHGRCLCVIVEPYPPVRQQRQMSLTPTGVIGPRAPSIAPPDLVPSGAAAAQRSKTPLFLPEDDDDDYYARRSVTAALLPQRSRPPVPLFHEAPNKQDEDDGGMLAFSQVLQSMGEHHTGATEDDDEMEGMVLFGDADEARGL